MRVFTGQATRVVVCCIVSPCPVSRQLFSRLIGIWLCFFFRRGDGDRSPVVFPTAFFRKRCAEDDFQVAVRNLGIQQTHAETDFTSRATGDTGNTTEKSEPDGLPNDSASRDKSEAISKGKETTAPEESKAEESKAEESKPGSNSSSRSDASGKASPAAAEHPLQKAITSFDMALGELNQLVHLVDLARAGEFMALERVTPSEEDQARGVPDQSVSRFVPAVSFQTTTRTSHV